MRVVSFGFSAFLKVICLSERAQKRKLKERLLPSDGGYNYHRSLDVLIQKVLGGASTDEINWDINKIKKIPERKSVENGLEIFSNWRKKNQNDICMLPNAIYRHPSGEFAVKYAPSFGMKIDGVQTSIAIWNTKEPKLIQTYVQGALHLAATAYANVENQPQDLAVLSLRNGVLYKLSDAREAKRIGENLATAIDIELRRLRAELGPASEHRRPSPPPPPPAE